MNTKGLIMSVVAVAVAAATYFGLEFAFPPVEEEHPGLARLAPVEEVFAGTLQAPSAPAHDEPTAPAENQVPEASADAQAIDDAVSAVDEASAGTEPPVTESESLTVSEPAPAVPAESEEPRPQPAAQSATATPPSTPEDTAPAAAPGKPATQPTPGKKAKKPEVITQWWGPESPTQLSLVYAGSAAYTRAIVLMFNGAFDDAAAAAAHLRVTDANGKTVNGSWQIGANNKRMLLFPVNKPGIYTVSVGDGLSDRQGRKIAKALKGPVRVQ
ncbi:hypothetical protein SAMN04488120_102197 [Fontimonas thermophila]|uniref:Uncharacterized protein n=1 Tax=Fontimonas thermophila TaxID=1076937 RepID=A0A1I2HRP2_9GAMM|nr:hypothetical protein [Fontimonas thermophila]SFF32794.1 hypothetical protein SAMN04488120_102197 [Fontimonas thermophila]